MVSCPTCLQQQDDFSPVWRAPLSGEEFLAITPLRPWADWIMCGHLHWALVSRQSLQKTILKWTMSPSSSPPVKPVTRPGELRAPWGASSSGHGGKSSLSVCSLSPSFCGVHWEMRQKSMENWSSIYTSICLACFPMKRRRKIKQVNKCWTAVYKNCIYCEMWFILAVKPSSAVHLFYCSNYWIVLDHTLP